MALVHFADLPELGLMLDPCAILVHAERRARIALVLCTRLAVHCKRTRSAARIAEQKHRALCVHEAVLNRA